MRAFPAGFASLFMLSPFLSPIGSAHALEPVTLQLKWSHAFQFAGYYAAKELGYYREAGLDVTIRPATPGGANPVRAVLSGEADFGVGMSDLLLARHGGAPVVVLAVIFQHSPLVLVSTLHGPTQGIHDLAGKRVMMEPQSEELWAYLKREGVPREGLNELPHGYDYWDLVDGRVDAISAYVTNEPWFLDQAGVRYQIHTPRSAGIDFYGDNLFTSEERILRHPGRVKAFREASLRGWKYAMAHPEEVANMIVGRYSDRDPKEFYLFEAARMAQLMRTDLIEVGYMIPGRWRHIADTYADLGLLPRGISLDGFLYADDSDIDHRPLYLGGALLLVVGGIAAHILRINRRLHHSLRENVRTAKALRLSEERHRLLADHASDVIWTIGLDGRFTYVSPSIERLRGVAAADTVAADWRGSLTAASAALVERHVGLALARLRRGRPVGDFRAELETPDAAGGTVWMEVTASPMRDGNGAYTGLVGVARDITERRAAAERIRHMAQHDPLTGLANRALFSDLLRQALAAARRDGNRSALLFLDLDHFKPINDTMGHAAGDQALREVAGRLTGLLRESDCVGRVGGDEFVILLRVVVDEVAAMEVAERVRSALTEPLFSAGGMCISTSIGVALFPDDGENETTLTLKADQALYRAKALGRNRVAAYGDGGGRARATLP